MATTSKARNGAAQKPFLTDVQTLRKNARSTIAKGAITDTYEIDLKTAIDLLQGALATEIVCVLRYTMHAVAATGIASEGAKSEFTQHAQEEQGHMMLLGRAHQPARRDAGLRSEESRFACGVAVWPARRKPGRHAQGKLDRRAYRDRSLSRTHQLLRCQGFRPRARCSRASWRWKKSMPATCTTCWWRMKDGPSSRSRLDGVDLRPARTHGLERVPPLPGPNRHPARRRGPGTSAGPCCASRARAVRSRVGQRLGPRSRHRRDDLAANAISRSSCRRNCARCISDCGKV